MKAHRRAQAVEQTQAPLATRAPAMVGVGVDEALDAGLESETPLLDELGAAMGTDQASAPPGDEGPPPWAEPIASSLGVDLDDWTFELGADIPEEAHAEGDRLRFRDRSPSKELLAEELAHAAQLEQGGGGAGVSSAFDAAETEAAVISDQVARGESPQRPAEAATAARMTHPGGDALAGQLRAIRNLAAEHVPRIHDELDALLSTDGAIRESLSSYFGAVRSQIADSGPAFDWLLDRSRRVLQDTYHEQTRTHLRSVLNAKLSDEARGEVMRWVTVRGVTRPGDGGGDAADSGSPGADGAVAGPAEGGPESGAGDEMSVETTEAGTTVSGMEEAEVAGEIETGARADELRRFAGRVRAEISGWQSQRGSANLVFDVTDLNRMYDEFRRDWYRRYQEATPPLAQFLDTGTTGSALREIASFNHQLHPDLLVAVGSRQGQGMLRHRYTLELQEGVSVSDILGATAQGATLTYDNAAGMHWEQQASVVFATASAGLTVSREDGVEANGLGVDVLTGDSPMASSPASGQLIYYSPADFESSMAYIATVEANVAGSVAGRGVTVGPQAKTVRLETDGRSVNFRDVEAVAVEEDIGVGIEDGEVDAGTGLSANASLSSGVGHVVPLPLQDAVSDPRNLRELEEHDGSPDTSQRIMAEVDLTYETGESAIGGPQERVLRDLVRQMERVERRFPGALFDARFQGYASPRWRGARTPAEALANNRRLAQDRTRQAQAAFRSMLSGQDVHMSDMVLALSRDEGSSEVAEEGVDGDNVQGARTVLVTVTYRPLAASERAGNYEVLPE
jgi:hypothetical protein